MSESLINQAEKGYWAIATSTPVVTRASKVALIVGTILALINHGENIMSLSLSTSDYFKVLLTYVVPFCVSTWSAVAAIKAK